jgi:hypothetical protein
LFASPPVIARKLFTANLIILIAMGLLLKGIIKKLRTINV